MKTAVILAARKEHDSELPYPLKPFTDGICLMDRTIGILRDNGYSNLIIVTGYRHELFSKYKAEDVSIIINNDYEFTASMGSLALCKDVIAVSYTHLTLPTNSLV